MQVLGSVCVCLCEKGGGVRRQVGGWLGEVSGCGCEWGLGGVDGLGCGVSRCVGGCGCVGVRGNTGGGRGWVGQVWPSH